MSLLVTLDLRTVAVVTSRRRKPEKLRVSTYFHSIHRRQPCPSEISGKVKKQIERVWIRFNSTATQLLNFSSGLTMCKGQKRTHANNEWRGGMAGSDLISLRRNQRRHLDLISRIL